MRITFLSPFTTLAGGVRVMATYAEMLQARGHEVTVVSTPPPTPSRRARLKVALGLGRIKQGERTRLLDWMGERHIVLDRIRPVTAADVPDGDAVIATWWETAPWVADLPAAKGRKFYLLQDYETYKKGYSDAVGATYDLPLKKIAVSDYIAGMLARHHGVEDVPVVPNSVDLAQFNAPERRKSDTLTVGFLYTGKLRKNVALAIEVLEQARAVIPGLRAVAFGSIAPLDRLPLPGWIPYHQAPPQEALARIYAGCDAWLFTSHHEGFGLPILEAMACGTPVLATSAGAAPQLINGQNGTLLEPEAAAFVAELQRLADLSPDDWRAMSDSARETAASYSWDDATERLLACLEAS